MENQKLPHEDRYGLYKASGLMKVYQTGQKNKKKSRQQIDKITSQSQHSSKTQMNASGRQEMQMKAMKSSGVSPTFQQQVQKAPTTHKIMQPEQSLNSLSMKIKNEHAMLEMKKHSRAQNQKPLIKHEVSAIIIPDINKGSPHVIRQTQVKIANPQPIDKPYKRQILTDKANFSQSSLHSIRSNNRKIPAKKTTTLDSNQEIEIKANGKINDSFLDDIRMSLRGCSAEKQTENPTFNLPQLDPSKVSSEASIVVEKQHQKKRGTSQHIIDHMHSSGMSMADAGTGGGLAYLDNSKGMVQSKTLLQGNGSMLNNSVDNLLGTLTSNQSKLDGPNDNYDDTNMQNKSGHKMSMYRNSSKLAKVKQASQISMITSKSHHQKNNDRYHTRSPYLNNSPTNEANEKMQSALEMSEEQRSAKKAAARHSSNPREKHNSVTVMQTDGERINYQSRIGRVQEKIVTVGLNPYIKKESIKRSNKEPASAGLGYPGQSNSVAALKRSIEHSSKDDQHDISLPPAVSQKDAMVNKSLNQKAKVEQMLEKTSAQQKATEIYLQSLTDTVKPPTSFQPKKAAFKQRHAVISQQSKQATQEDPVQISSMTKNQIPTKRMSEFHPVNQQNSNIKVKRDSRAQAASRRNANSALNSVDKTNDDSSSGWNKRVTMSSKQIKYQMDSRDRIDSNEFRQQVQAQNVSMKLVSRQAIAQKNMQMMQKPGRGSATKRKIMEDHQAEVKSVHQYSADKDHSFISQAGTSEKRKRDASALRYANSSNIRKQSMQQSPNLNLHGYRNTDNQLTQSKETRNEKLQESQTNMSQHLSNGKSSTKKNHPQHAMKYIQKPKRNVQNTQMLPAQSDTDLRQKLKNQEMLINRMINQQMKYQAVGTNKTPLSQSLILATNKSVSGEDDEDEQEYPVVDANQSMEEGRDSIQLAIQTHVPDENGQKLPSREGARSVVHHQIKNFGEQALGLKKSINSRAQRTAEQLTANSAAKQHLYSTTSSHNNTMQQHGGGKQMSNSSTIRLGHDHILSLQKTKPVRQGVESREKTPVRPNAKQPTTSNLNLSTDPDKPPSTEGGRSSAMGAKRRRMVPANAQTASTAQIHTDYGSSLDKRKTSKNLVLSYAKGSRTNLTQAPSGSTTNTRPSIVSQLARSSTHNNTLAGIRQVSSNKFSLKKKDKDSASLLRQRPAPHHDPAVDPKKFTLEEFELISFLGKGSFGTVKLVRHMPTNKMYAFKCINKEQVKGRKHIQHVRNEAYIMKQFKPADFFCNLFKTFQDRQHLYFMLEFLPGGELYKLMRNMGAELNEEVARFYLAEVLLGIEKLHQMNIIYRDLKPENVLIDKKGHIKLIDFGFSKQLNDIRNDRTFTNCGTPGYCAPEVMLEMGYNYKADIWSWGILICEMIGGFSPFEGKGEASNPRAIMEKIRYGDIGVPKNMVGNARDLVKLVLTDDMSRLEIEQIKRHKFFRSIDWAAMQRRDHSPPYVPDPFMSYTADVAMDKDMSIGMAGQAVKKSNQNSLPNIDGQRNTTAGLEDIPETALDAANTRHGSPSAEEKKDSGASALLKPPNQQVKQTSTTSSKRYSATGGTGGTASANKNMQTNKTPTKVLGNYHMHMVNKAFADF